MMRNTNDQKEPQPHHDLISNDTITNEKLKRSYLLTHDRQYIYYNEQYHDLCVENKEAINQMRITPKGIHYFTTMTDGGEVLQFIKGSNPIPAYTSSGQIIYVGSKPRILYVKLIPSIPTNDLYNKKPNTVSSDNQDEYSSSYLHQGRQGAGQVQSQQFKNTQKVDLTNKQIFANDSHGRLYAEVERLLWKKGVEFQPKYSKYLLNQTASTKECLESIETFLETIAFYSDYSLQSGVKDHDFADDPESFHIWSYALELLTTNSKVEQITFDVIKHVVNCCLSKKIKLLPEEYSERIKKQSERDHQSNQVLKIGLTMLFRCNIWHNKW